MFINIISFIISIIIFLILNIFNSHFDFLSQKAVLKAGFIVNSENQNDIKNVSSNHKIQTNEEEWYLKIPSINLNAKIAEGTNEEVINKFVGHFTESKKWVGNVCLAAHNRGYENNYFSDLKKLKEEDVIYYYYQNMSREYKVIKNIIVKDTDLSYLENTEDNMLTLITCVENEPNYRRCVQAIESNS